MEYELLDTGVFDGDRYLDVFVEYAKGGTEDILLQITPQTGGWRRPICISCRRSGSEAIGRRGPPNLTQSCRETKISSSSRRRQARALRGYASAAG